MLDYEESPIDDETTRNQTVALSLWHDKFLKLIRPTIYKRRIPSFSFIIIEID